MAPKAPEAEPKGFTSGPILQGKGPDPRFKALGIALLEPLALVITSDLNPHRGPCGCVPRTSWPPFQPLSPSFPPKTRMKSSTRGAARVNAIWLIVALVLFFAALFAWYTANDAAVLAEERADTAEQAATQAQEEARADRAALRTVSEILGYYDREDISATTVVETAQDSFNQFKAAIGPDADDAIKSFEEAWPLAIQKVSGLDTALSTAKQESTQRSTEVSAARSSAAEVASTKDAEIARLTRELADLQEKTTEEINGLEGQVARLTAERNEFDQEGVNVRDEIESLKVAHALQLSEYEARMNQILSATRPFREVGGIDGKIVGTSPKLGMAFINRGRKHRIVRGMVFEVMDADPANPTLKGEIEVLNVMDDISEVAIRKVSDKYDAIALGDTISNPMYSPEGNRNAVLVGRFDGKYSRSEVALLLKEIGITVQSELDRSTMYMIMGNPLYKDPETGEALEEPLNVKDLPVFAEAKSWGVQMISIAELRHFFKR